MEVALRWADPPPKESYRLCVQGQAQQRAAELLMAGWLNDIVLERDVFLKYDCVVVVVNTWSF